MSITKEKFIEESRSILNAPITEHYYNESLKSDDPEVIKKLLESGKTLLKTYIHDLNWALDLYNDIDTTEITDNL